MRILVLFDLPVKKKSERHQYTQFHRFLLQDGYDMIQYSIYCRICAGLDAVKKHMKRLETHLPNKGAIRSMIITEKQFQDMKILVGTPTVQEEKIGYKQLSLF